MALVAEIGRRCQICGGLVTEGSKIWTLLMPKIEGTKILLIFSLDLEEEEGVEGAD